MSTIPNTFDKDKPRFKKNPNDFFVTPNELALSCVSTLHGLQFKETSKILDIGCGTGVWGKAAKTIYPQSQLTGVEINSDIVVDSNLDIHNIYDLIYIGDYINKYTVGEHSLYDLIVGNPPYSSATNGHLAEDIVLTSLTRLTDNGYLGLLLKSEFKASARRYENIFKNYAPLFEYQCVQRPNWVNYKKGSNTIEYSFFIWGKEVNRVTTVNWLDWR